MKIPAFVNQAISRIESYGFEALAVGGCVRDSLLSKTPSDWDITTSASPDDILRVFADFKTIPTGIKHGTITVIIDKNPIEITTYRIDGTYKDNRHPESVVFSNNLQDDLSRRDFTVNAMAYSPSTGIIDLFNGKSDLAERTVRCVGNPEKRFKEDALRIMRALRFAAVLDFKIEDTTSSALHRLFPLLENIAAERIMAELNKLLIAKNPHNILSEYSDVFLFIFGASEYPNIWKENLRVLLNTPCNLELRLAVLLRGFESPSVILRRLRYDNKTRHTVNNLLEMSDLLLPESKTDVKKILSEYGEKLFKLFLNFKEAEGVLTNKANQYLSEIIENNECYSLKSLAITGKDLQNHFTLQGRQLGGVLDTLLDAVICEKCINECDALLEFVKLHII